MTLTKAVGICLALFPWVSAAQNTCSTGNCDVKDDTNLMQMQKTLNEGTSRMMEAPTVDDDEKDLTTLLAEASDEEREAFRKFEDAVAASQKSLARKSEEYESTAVISEDKGKCCCKDKEPLQLCLTGKDKDKKSCAEDQDGNDYCCKVRDNWHGGCDALGGYPTPVTDFTTAGVFRKVKKLKGGADGKKEGKMDAATCKMDPNLQAWFNKESENKLKSIDCTSFTSAECKKDTVNKCNARHISVKSTRCKVVITLSCFFNNFGDGVIGASDTVQANTGQVAATVKEELSKVGQEAMGGFEAIFNPISLGISFLAVIGDILELLAGICGGADGLVKTTKCEKGLSVFKIACGILGIVLALTGVGVPFIAVAGKFFLERFIPMIWEKICKIGMGATIEYYFGEAKEGVKAMGESMKNNANKALDWVKKMANPAEFFKATGKVVLGLAKMVWQFFVSLIKSLVVAIWKLLKFIPNVIVSIYDKVSGKAKAKKDEEKEAEFEKDYCCSVHSAEGNITAMAEVLGTNPDDTSGCWQSGLTPEYCCVPLEDPYFKHKAEEECFGPVNTKEKCCQANSYPNPQAMVDASNSAPGRIMKIVGGALKAKVEAAMKASKTTKP